VLVMARLYNENAEAGRGNSGCGNRPEFIP